MAHFRTLGALAALTALAAPAEAARQAAPHRVFRGPVPVHVTAPSARIDMVRGRAVLLGGGHDANLVRRGDKVEALGGSHIEISAGSQARIRWSGALSVEVWGPSALEWTPDDEGLSLVFHEIAWADVVAHGPGHRIELPADWHATLGRASLHLRGLGGGPTEVRCNAGEPVILEWRGSQSELRPPFGVYPGSSVRLDRPRFARRETKRSRRQMRPWASDKSAQGETWPVRRPADSLAQRRERTALAREVDRIDELPGLDDAQVTKLRTYEANDSSSVRPIRRDETHAQVPVAPLVPMVETVPSDVLKLPARGETEPVSRGVLAVEAPGPAAAPRAVPYDSAQWRGLPRRVLNGAGDVAAEQSEGVEVRALGTGRVKVLVSSKSSRARWCFTRSHDYLVSPGSVVVFAEDGSVSMQLGDVQRRNPIAGRPSFRELR